MELTDLHSLAGRSPDVGYWQAVPDRSARPPAPSFTVGPLPADFEGLFFGDHYLPQAGVFTVDNLRITGELTLQFQGQTLAIPQNGIHRETIADAAAAAARARNIRVIAEDVVLLCGPGRLMYGHWLVDFLPRLHLLTAAGHDITRLRYLMPQPIQAYVVNWLRLLGIDPTQIIPYDVDTDICAIARAIIPTNLRGHSRAHYRLGHAMGAFKSRLGIPAQPMQRDIFVSRRNWCNQTRRLVNAEAIEALFAAEGFEIVFPETMPIPDQVALFNGARLIAGEYGSGLHNAVFAPPGASIVALRGTMPHPWFLQSGLCAALSQPCGYVFGETTITGGHQVFSVAPGDAARGIALARAAIMPALQPSPAP